MLRHLLPAALLLAAAAPTFAQSQPASAAQLPRFCVVRSSGFLNDARPSLTADYGRAAKKDGMPEVAAEAEAFRKERLSSVPDMLDYLDRTGWELLQTNAIAGPGATLLEYQYIFRRKAGPAGNPGR